MRSFLTWLVLCFPAAFREEFGEGIKEQINTDYGRALERGAGAAVGFGLLTALDLVRAGFAERWNPTWVGGQISNGNHEGEGMMTMWIRDLYHAYRSLRRAPAFTAMTVVTLGVAIGANAGIFAVVDGVMLNPLPFPNADRLVYIAASAPGSDLPEEFAVSGEFYIQYREQADVLEDVALYNSFTTTLRVGDRAERVRMSAPTPSLFSTLEVTPILGRIPSADAEGREAVISHAAWVDWFGADPAVIGQSYSMSFEDRTIVGVMGSEFRFPVDDVMVWFPGEILETAVTPGRFGSFAMVARVAPGVERAAVVSQLDMLAKRLPERFGGSARYAEIMGQHRPVVRSIRDEILGDVSGPLWVLLGAVSVVLLIACANVSNLFLVRAEQRQRDLAVMRAIGAGGGQLARAQMAEALLVAGLSGIFAVGLAWLGLPLFVAAAPGGIPRIADVAISPETLGFAVLACFFCALVCGLVPALRSATASTAGLGDGSRGSTRRRHWGRDGLVVAQTALALVLLVGSGLLVRSFQQLSNVDPGYDTADVFTFQIGAETVEGLMDGPTYARFHMDMMDRIRALPGVESVGIVENVPLNEGVRNQPAWSEGTADGAQGGSLVGLTFAGGDYYATMGISVLRGRAFEDDDHIANLGNVVISESAATALWPGEEALGRRLQWSDDGTLWTVVGVVEDVMQNSFRDEPQALLYLAMVGQTPDAWRLTSPAYVVKTTRAEVIGPEIREIVRAVAPGSPMYRMYTMEGLAADSMQDLTFTMLTLGFASLLALLLGTVGLYGVLSYVVAERTREIGVRMALGAQASQVRRMVVVQGARVTAFGVVLGVVAAAGATRVLGGLLYGLAAVDVATFAVVSMTVLLVGLAASYLPARRASIVDPIESLRG